MKDDRQDRQNAYHELTRAINQLKRRLETLEEQLPYRSYTPEQMRVVARILKRVCQEVLDELPK